MFKDCKFLVFDIETIHDKKAMESDFHKRGVDNYDDYIKKLLELKPGSNTVFAKLPFHHIVCISYVYIRMSDCLVKESVISGPYEQKIIEHFWNVFKYIYTNGSFPILVTFNGKAFDVPTIRLRSMKYIDDVDKDIVESIHVFNDTSDKWENKRPNYLNRYSKYHIDLQKDLDESWGNYFSLANICAINNIPVKETAHGDGVENLVQNGKWKELEKYCLDDSLATAQLLMKFLRFSGIINMKNWENTKIIEEKIDIIRKDAI